MRFHGFNMEKSAALIWKPFGVLVLVNAHSTADLGKVFENDVVALASSRGRMHQFEGQVGNKFSSHSTAVKGYSGAVGNDDTKHVIRVLALADEGGRCKVGIGVLNFAVKGNSVDILVSSSRGLQHELLGEVAARGDRAALLALHAGNIPGEVSVGHGDLYMLYNCALDAFDGLSAAIGDVKVSSDLFSVVVDILLQSHLQVKFTTAKSESFGH